MHVMTQFNAYYTGTPQSSQAVSSLHTAGRETIESYASSDMPMQDSMDPITSRETSQGYAYVCVYACIYMYGTSLCNYILFISTQTHKYNPKRSSKRKWYVCT
jgi:hypothetical protein